MFSNGFKYEMAFSEMYILTTVRRRYETIPVSSSGSTSMYIVMYETC